MKWTLLLTIITLTIGNGFAQESEEKEPLYKSLITVQDAVYHFGQISTGFARNQPMVGLQYKRLRHENVYYFSLTSGFSAATHWTRLKGENVLQSSLEVHARSYPYTLTFRFGMGLDLQTNFKDRTFVSFYPSVGYDLGFAEISYAYLVNGRSDEVLAKHRLKLAVGWCIKKKKKG